MQLTVRQDRDKYIGGSDIAAVMGVSAFATRWDLIQEKLHGSEFTGNEYTRYGEEMEPKIREYVSEMALSDFVEDVRIKGNRRYHADGFDGKIVLEIKTTSQIHDNAEDYKAYILQLQMGMDMFDVREGYLAVYERPSDFNTEFDPFRLQLFRVKRDDLVIGKIRTAIRVFWKDVEALKETPSLAIDELPSSQPLVPLIEDVITYSEMETEMKDIVAMKKVAMKELMKNMDAAALYCYENDRFRVTRVADGEDKEVMVLNEERLKRDCPGLWEQYSEPKVKKGKSGYVRVTAKRGHSDGDSVPRLVESHTNEG